MNQGVFEIQQENSKLQNMEQDLHGTVCKTVRCSEIAFTDS